MRGNIYIYIFTAAIVSYLIRVLPLTLIRKQIKNKFIKSFLYYVPYVTLAVMTFPAIIQATQSPWAGAIALVVGSEGEGVSRLVLKNSDYIVKIPQYGHVNSLNASVAAAILLSRIRS